MNAGRYAVRAREDGLTFETCATIEEAREIIREYEEIDRSEGTYTPRFYEIYDLEQEEIIDD